MSKARVLMTIHSCLECWHFEDGKAGFRCNAADRWLEGVASVATEIPPWCPLPPWKEEEK
jgi:hypothetical protein